MAPRWARAAQLSIWWLVALGSPAVLAEAPQGDSASAPASAARFMPARLNADPNEAAYGFELRSSVRGRFSDAFNFVGDDYAQGYRLMLLPLIELSEPRRSSNVLPSQYWRARISIEQGYGFSLDHLYAYVGLALTHESDHETSHPYAKPGFLALNDVDLRLSLAASYDNWAFNAGVDAFVFIVSCTEPSRLLCKNFRGDSSLGGQAQISAAYTGLRALRATPFASASASGILARGLVETEQRLSMRAGLYLDLQESTFAIFALGWFGSDVSILRNEALNAAGVGASFTR